MLPELVDGVLPEGIHDTSLKDVEEVFGRFQRSDRRIRLTEKLRRFVENARRSRLVEALVLDGSYVTAKEEPSDIDLLVVLRPDVDETAELRPFEYNVLSRKAVKRQYHFDALVVKPGSARYAEYVAFFSSVKADDPGLPTRRTAKGLVRVKL